MNNVQLLGRLVKDADFQKGEKGKKSYAKFTMAVARGKDETDFNDNIALDGCLCSRLCPSQGDFL